MMNIFQEALNDMNEELQENARATELELREELDLKSIKLFEVKCGIVYFYLIPSVIFPKSVYDRIHL